jgi:hypothetical protein
VAESSLPLGCAHIGGKSTYAISCVLPTSACPTPPPSAAYALYLRDRRISIHIAALCAHYYFRPSNMAIACKSMPRGSWRDNPKCTSPAVLKFDPRSCRRIPSWAPKHCLRFQKFCQKIDAWLLHFYLRRCEMLSGLLWRSVCCVHQALHRWTPPREMSFVHDAL